MELRAGRVMSFALIASIAASGAWAKGTTTDFAALPASGPGSYCGNPGVKASIIREMNDTSSGPYLAGAPVRDVKNLTTLSVSADGRLFACHGVFEFDDGAQIPAIFQIKPAIGHGALAGYVPDRASGSM